MNDFYDDEFDDEPYVEARPGREGDWGSVDVYDDLDLESLAEAPGIGQVLVRDHSRTGPTYRGASSTVRVSASPGRVRGTGGGTVQTPAGNAKVQFPVPVATAASVDARLQELKKEQAKLSAAINALSKSVVKNTAMLDKKVNTLNVEIQRTTQQTKQMQLLSLLLQPQPKLESLTVKGPDDKIPRTFEVTDQKFKKDEDSILPFILMMSGTNGMSDPTMLLALTGAFK